MDTIIMKAASAKLRSDCGSRSAGTMKAMMVPDLTIAPCSLDSHPESSSSFRDVVEEARTSHKRKRKKSVSWGIVDVRLYGVIPGDHPCTSDGPPLTMEWEAFQETKGMDINVYDANSPHRRETELVLDGVERWKILKSEGFTDMHIVASIRASKRFQRKRVQTLHRKKYEKVDELQEAMVRSMKRSFMRKVILETRY